MPLRDRLVLVFIWAETVGAGCYRRKQRCCDFYSVLSAHWVFRGSSVAEVSLGTIRQIESNELSRKPVVYFAAKL